MVITSFENRADNALADFRFYLYAFDVDRLFDRVKGRSEQEVRELLDRGQILSRVSVGRPRSGKAADEWAVYYRQLCGWHADRSATLQVVVGGELLAHDGRMKPGWAGDLASASRDFSKARFDLLAGCDHSRRETSALASRLPNVSVAASWRHNFSASSISEFIGREVHEVPMTKLTGFASGASSAEWTYGKFQMFRKATALAFARLIEAGYYEEDEIPPILLQILHDTPFSLYSLEK